MVTWNTRRLKQAPVQSLQITEINSQGKQVIFRATILQNSAQTITKYFKGTQQGTVIVAKKPIEINLRLETQNRHLGPIYSISRNLQFSKVLMAVGDWFAKIWMDDLRTPFMKTSIITHIQVMDASLQVEKDGQLDVWDYYRQNQIAFFHKVFEACIKISYAGSENLITGGKLIAIGVQEYYYNFRIMQILIYASKTKKIL